MALPNYKTDPIFVVSYSISFADRVKSDKDLAEAMRGAASLWRFRAADQNDAYNFFCVLNRRLYGINLGPEDVKVARDVVEAGA